MPTPNYTIDKLKQHFTVTINELLPTQSGNSGKFLTTNGETISWATVDALPSQTGQSGKFLTTNGTTATWETVDALPSQTNNSGKYLTTNGSSASWGSISYTNLTDKPDLTLKANVADLATVATSGSYNDLSNTPTIPTVPTNVSSFTNDSGYITGVSWDDISNKPSTFTPAEHNHDSDYADINHNHDGVYAPLASPALTGTPTAPTATAGDNSTQIATTAYVDSAVSGLVDSAPTTLDTLNELAAALGDDPNFATTVATSIGGKLDSNSANYVKSLSISGTTITVTKGDNTTSTLTTQDTTYSLPEATTSTLGGVIVGTGLSVSSGTISADDQLPSQTGNSGKYLTTNGTTASWSTVDALPSQTGNNGKYLTTNGSIASWVNINEYTLPIASSSILGGIKVGTNLSIDSETGVLSATDTVYTHPTTSGNKHIPSGGSSGKILVWSADGTATWGDDTDTVTTVTVTGDGNAITNITDSNGALTATKGSTFSLSTHNHDSVYSAINHDHDSSYTPITTGVGSATQGVYTNSNGVITAMTYELNKTVPADAVFTDTVYTHPTTSGNKHIPSGGSTGQFLKWSADGTATWAADNDTTYSAGDGLSLTSTTFSLDTATASTIGGVKIGSGITITDGVISADSQIPTQTNNGGKYLTTDGSALSWATVDALPSQTNNSGKFLTTNGTAASWATIFSGEVRVSSTHHPTAAATTIVLTTVQVPENNIEQWGLSVYRDGIYLIDGIDYTYASNSRTLTFTRAFEANEVVSVNFAYLSSDSGTSGSTTLPTQTGQSGKFLTTNGTDASWSTLPIATTSALGAIKVGTNLSINSTTGVLSATDQLPTQTNNSGKFLTTNGTTASWATVDALPSQSGNSGKVLTTNGTTASWTTDAFTSWDKDYNDLTNKPTIPTVPTDISAFTNDSGYITGVSWNDVTDKPSTFTPATHNHDSEYTAKAASVGSGINPIYTNSSGELTASSSTVGTATQPVYLNNGTITAGTYELNKTVPADAVFTDTTYTDFVGSGASAASGLVPKPSTTAGTTKYLREDGSWEVPPNDNTVTTATTSGSGNAVTAITASNGALTVTKGDTFVNLSSTQTITGAKYFTNQVINQDNVFKKKNTSITRASTEEQNVQTNTIINGTDSVGNSLMTLYTTYRYSSEDSYVNNVRLGVYDPTTTDYTHSSIGIGYNQDGVFTSAPTPPTADNSTQIATTAYVKSNLSSYAPLESPAFTGTPTAPTATAGTNSTQIATTAYVDTAVSNLVNSAPTTLDTLAELSAALGDDPNFATTVATNIGNKLSTNSSGYIKSLSISGKTITYTKGDNTTGTLTTQDTTYTQGTGITISNGVISADNQLPTQTNNSGKFLTTNGTTASWATVDALPSQSGNSGKYLTTNGSAASWATIESYTLPTASDSTLGGIKIGTNLSIDGNGVLSATDTVYTHPTTSGNKHIPSGGSAGQFLKWSADGTAVWAADNNTVTTVSVTGSGNAITNITDSNGALTATKGNTFVDIGSAQTITGTKSDTKNFNFVNIDPGSDDMVQRFIWGFQDTGNTPIGAFIFTNYANGSSRTIMRAQVGNKLSDISIQRNSDNTVVTQAPTPATSDNSTQIATTAFVKSNLSNYLPLTGGTVTGTITANRFDGPISIFKLDALNTDNVAGTVTHGFYSLISDSRACKTAFLPASNITIEYSSDGGATWVDYGASDAQKVNLFSMTREFSPLLGKGASGGNTEMNLNCKLRVTIKPETGRYCFVNLLYLYLRSYNHTMKVDIERSTIGAPTTFSVVRTSVPVSGWSGPNVISFEGGQFGGGSNQTNNKYAYRFTFYCTAIGANTSDYPCVIDIRMYGPTTWQYSNSMMFNDHMYSWDYNKNVTFPANVTATKFIGALQGNADTATKLGITDVGSATQPIYLDDGVPTATTYTLCKSVPSDAVFTDTVYTHPTTSGNKHIPSGGSSGQVLVWSSDGTATWGNASDSALPSQTGNSGKYLTTNGTSASWSTIASYTLPTAAANTLGGIKVGTNLSIDANGVLSATDTTYSVFGKSGSTASTGLVPKPSTTAGTTKYLREDGTWTVPPNDDTVYTLPKATTSTLGGVIVGSGLSVNNGTISANNQLPSQTSNSGKFLTTNGTTASWATVDALPTQTNNAGKFLKTNGTTASWEDVLDTEIKISSIHYPSANATTITLTAAESIPTDLNKYALSVYRNGIYMLPSIDYGFNSTTKVLTFTQAFDADEVVAVLFTYLSSDTQATINLDVDEYEAGSGITFTENPITGKVVISSSALVETLTTSEVEDIFDTALGLSNS